VLQPWCQLFDYEIVSFRRKVNEPLVASCKKQVIDICKLQAAVIRGSWATAGLPAISRLFPIGSRQLGMRGMARFMRFP